jgi:hypothetical protein
LCQNVYTLSVLFTYSFFHVPDFTNQHPAEEASGIWKSSNFHKCRLKSKL